MTTTTMTREQFFMHCLLVLGPPTGLMTTGNPQLPRWWTEYYKAHRYYDGGCTYVMWREWCEQQTHD